MRARAAVILTVMALGAGAQVAAAQAVRYAGPHPIPPAEPGAFCHIGVLHVHGYQPGEGAELVAAAGALEFVGDPSEHGYEGVVVAYRGAHPVEGDSICTRDGDHFHLDAPAGDGFREVEGAFVYELPEAVRVAAAEARAAAEALEAERREVAADSPEPTPAREARRPERRARAARPERERPRRPERPAETAEREPELPEPADDPVLAADPLLAEPEPTDTAASSREQAFRAWMARRRGN